MAGYYTAEQMQRARQADLFLFMQYHFPNEVIKQGNSLRLKKDRSVSIKKGYSGAYDFSKDKGYSGIDLLMEYLGYSLPDAVFALSGTDAVSISAEPQEQQENTFVLPPRSPTTYRIRRYLQGRGIDGKVIDWFISKGLLFEDMQHNCCFLNKDIDYLEKRGTWEPPTDSDKEPFRQIQKKRSTNYWSFGDKTGRCYVCESCIDSMSLYQLRREKACYVSLGGVSNFETIKRLISEFGEVWLAVDNDRAGERCRQRFADLPYILPQNKDWNEDLIKQKNKSR